MKTMREIYIDKKGTSKHIDRFFKKYSERYDIESVDEELEPIVELALRIHTKELSIMEVLVELTNSEEDDGYDPDPQKMPECVISFKEEKIKREQAFAEREEKLVALFEKQTDMYNKLLSTIMQLNTESHSQKSSLHSLSAMNDASVEGELMPRNSEQIEDLNNKIKVNENKIFIKD